MGLCLAAWTSHAAEKMVFIPQWTPQAQFAGFYVAMEKGFYAEEGLDVEIRHLKQHSTENCIDLLLADKAQIVGQQLIQSIVSRADGVPLVNVMQLTQVSGLWCVSHTPISKPEDLDGKKVGRWQAGFSEFGEIMEFSKGIKVNWIPFIKSVNLYIYGAVDATLCYSYNEYLSLLAACGEISDNQLLKFSDFGYDCPEDGLYVTEDYYNKNKDKVDAFVRASKKGWDYARAHQEEALDINQKYIDEAHIITNRIHQKMMLEEYLRLQVNPKTGVPDYAPVRPEVFNDICKALLSTHFTTRMLDHKELIR